MSKKKKETGKEKQAELKAGGEMSTQSLSAGEDSFDDLGKKDSFSEAALWITVAALVLVLSTWTAWFPYVFPESTSAVGLVQTKDVEKLATKISTLEAKIPDVSGDVDQSQLQPFFQPLLRRMGENEVRFDALSEQVQKLETQLSALSEKFKSSNSFKSAKAEDKGFWSSKTDIEDSEELIQKLQNAHHSLEEATRLNQSFRDTTGRFMKAFALYEALETSLNLGENYRKSLEALKNLIGASFEEEAFQILLSFADLGIPSGGRLIGESQDVLASQRVLETPTKAKAVPQGNTFNRVVTQLKSLVKVRHKKELDSDDKSDFEHLEKASQDFMRRDFDEGLSSLEKIKNPSDQVAALQAHATAYIKGRKALLRIKKHLYSPIFLEEIWSRYNLKNEEK